MQTTWRRSARARSRSPTTPRRLAADPGVDLVEDERPATARRAQPAQRQHHPRELAARGGVAQRCRPDARVGRDPQLDRLGPVGPVALGVRLRATTSRLAPAIASCSSSAATRDSSCPAALRPAAGQLRGAAAARRSSAAASSRLELGRALLGVLRAARSPPGSARRARAPRRCVPPCFRFSRSRTPRRSSTAAEAARVGLDPIEVGAQLARQVVELDRAATRSARPVPVELRRRPRRRPGSRPAPRPAGRPRRRRPRSSPAIAAEALAAASRSPSAWRSRSRSASELIPLLGGVGRRGLDLGELEAQQVEVALARARRARAARPAPPPAASTRGARRGRRGRSSSCSGPAKPSRISSWAEEIVSLRCSCWP